MLNRSNSFAFRFLCLLMAGLTACSTTRSSYAWHDVGAETQQGKMKLAEIQENWGAKPEKPDTVDPAIAPGFLLNVTCAADNKLTGDYRVEFNGDLPLPYGVIINTTGDTLSQLKQKLADRFRSYFKSPADIDIRVKERRNWLDVRGLVEKPGRYLVEPEASLDMLIGLAGGTSKESPPLYVRIQKGSKIFIFDLNQYYSQGEDHPQILGWLGGEVLFFQKEGTGALGERTSAAPYRLPIYMMGEVRKPGDYNLVPGSDFLDTLVQAGGFTERADLDDIEIIRRTGGRKRVYDFSWNDLQRAPTPQQGDIVFVHADNTTKFERHTTLVTAVISALATVITAGILVLAYNKGRI